MNTTQTFQIGDTTRLIKTLPKIDLVITSPPYNVGIDYGTYKDNLPVPDYISWLTDIFIEISTKLTPGGHICINIINSGRSPYIPIKDLLVCSLTKSSWGLEHRGEIIWYKQNTTAPTAWGSWMSPNMPSIRDVHEYIIVFRKPGTRRGTSDMTKEEFTTFTKSYWHITPEFSKKHPAPFPLDLAKRLIKLYSFPNEIVFDPFLGSGTTLKACYQLNRNGIGFELNPAYAKLINEAISADTRLSQEEHDSLFDMLL